MKRLTLIFLALGALCCSPGCEALGRTLMGIPRMIIKAPAEIIHRTSQIVAENETGRSYDDPVMLGPGEFPGYSPRAFGRTAQPKDPSLARADVQD